MPFIRNLLEPAMYSQKKEGNKYQIGKAKVFRLLGPIIYQLSLQVEIQGKCAVKAHLSTAFSSDRYFHPKYFLLFLIQGTINLNKAEHV